MGVPSAPQRERARRPFQVAGPWDPQLWPPLGFGGDAGPPGGDDGGVGLGHGDGVGRGGVPGA
jgi:hypothetical protein